MTGGFADEYSRTTTALKKSALAEKADQNRVVLTTVTVNGGWKVAAAAAI